MFAYCLNNPITNTDYTGDFAFSTFAITTVFVSLVISYFDYFANDDTKKSKQIDNSKEFAVYDNHRRNPKDPVHDQFLAGNIDKFSIDNDTIYMVLFWIFSYLSLFITSGLTIYYQEMILRKKQKTVKN